LIERDLTDCQTAGLSSDWRLNIVYNAALQAATIAFAASGYRSARDSHHYRIIQSLAHSINASSGLIAHFDHFRKKRNIGGYERAGIASDQKKNVDEFDHLYYQITYHGNVVHPCIQAVCKKTERAASTGGSG